MPAKAYDRHDRPSPYGVKWYANGRRHFRFFARASDRDAFLADLRRSERAEGNAILRLTAAQAALFERCVAMVGSEDALLDACQRYAEARPPVEITAEQAVQQYLTEKRATGRDALYLSTLRTILAKLTAMMPDDIEQWTAERARAWSLALTDDYAESTVRGMVRTASGFGLWCVSKRYTSANWFADAPMPRAVETEIGFLPVADAERLLVGAVEGAPELVAYLALGLFAGLRSSTCVRLPVETIDYAERGISIPAEAIKTRARVYIDGFEPNLWAWLEWARDHAPDGFSLTKGPWDTGRKALADAVGVSMPHNALRHSFATYHVALYRDAGKTATLLAHRGNVSMLYQHYRGNATNAQAREYFAILPP